MKKLFGGRLQIVLIASFSVIAALTVGLNTLVTSRVIQDYLAAAEANLVAATALNRALDRADRLLTLLEPTTSTKPSSGRVVRSENTIIVYPKS